MSHKVDLGQKLRDVIGMPQAVGPEDERYPHLHIDDHPDPRLLNMPDEGKATIHYKVRHREHREHTDDKGKKKHKHSVTLEVRDIEHDEKEPKKRNHNDEARSAAKSYFAGLNGE